MLRGFGIIRTAAGRGHRLAPIVGLLAVLSLLIGLASAEAQETPAATAAQPTAEQIDNLVATLEDPAAREKLIEQLRLLRAAQAEAEPAEAEAEAGVLGALSDRVDRTSAALAAAAGVLADLPELAGDLVAQAADPDVRASWLDLLMKLAVVLIAAFFAQWLIGRLLARSRRAVENNGARSLWVRIPLIVGHALIDLIPVVAFATVAYSVLPLTEPRAATRLVTLAIVNAHIAVRVIAVIAQILLAPAVSSLRLAPLSDESANYAYIWVLRLATVTIYGYFLLEAAFLLGLPYDAYGFLLRVLGLVVTAMLVVLILQNRATTAAWLRRDGSAGRLRQVRQRLAEVWHILAIAYVVAIFAVWALGIAGGFGFLLRATVLTALIVLLARLAVAALRRLIERAFRLSTDLRTEFPNLEARANRYLPLLQRVLEVVIYIVAALALLEVWGLEVFDWFRSEVGRRIFGSVLAIFLILAVAVALSELVGMLIERYLQRMDGNGMVLARSARVRTLLPLLRNAFRVTLAIVVGLIVLAELGINIGPLLAAAGVAGLAIGFGAQTLVQDIITGVFILAEDSISIGDVVDLGGHSGVVEAMTIRTIRLRDLSGTVHTIPFSSVSTVQNLTKEFSYAVFTIGVAYREDVDEVIEVLKGIGAELQADEQFGPEIIGEMEVFGLDSFGDSAVNIKGRIMTRPLKQWMVAREFNRRVKRAFDEKGIEIPFPHQTLYFGEDKTGNAPPVHVRMESPGTGASSSGKDADPHASTSSA
ncbi:mechanosensitive ion channel domain-containing protein [Virgifigura deserti]|uniref:mechanosensitive ion channel domain-containing protein n=1 Tax=Virgifigura deserti TaxID=2268457 RepID=UPI003CCBE91E